MSSLLKLSNDTLEKQRIALCVEYDGSGYFGWQRQGEPYVPTVQHAVEQALSQVADHEVRVHCAGRTDSGVHARYQIVHFDAPSKRSAKAWVMGGNAHLPAQVALQWAIPVDSDFHARFSAVSRSYRYVINNALTRSALGQGQETVIPHLLDEDAMNKAAQALLGEQDFSAFRAAACQSNSSFRCVEQVSVRRHDHHLCVDIRANAFLLHMVRNIVGSLINIGRGKQSSEWIAALLRGGDRSLASATAPPDGLCLMAVRYPEHYGLPLPAANAIRLI